MSTAKTASKTTLNKQLKKHSFKTLGRRTLKDYDI